ncbi:MAG TPA: hypothetical protein VGE52_10175, partial [Pirellulales bacterium]
FNAAWAPGEQMGSMRDGSGDHFFAHFSAAGGWLKGFVHEATMSPFSQEPPTVWPGVLESVPVEFAECLKEPAFNLDETTFCLWRRPTDDEWQIGPIEFPGGELDPDGSGELLSPLDGDPETYQRWAEEYYECDVNLAAVEQIYAHAPLTAALLKQLAPNRPLSALVPEAEEIGYPLQ